MTIQELQQLMISFCEERDRSQFHNPKDCATAIAIEAGELMEKFLRKTQQESYEIAKSDSDVEEEFADIMNNVLLFAHATGIDIEKAVMNKIEKNKKKYPVEKAKGRSEKYDKL